MTFFYTSKTVDGVYFPTTYSIRILDAFGFLLKTLPFIEVSYASAINEIGTLTVLLPISVPKTLLVKNNRIEVWRNVEGKTYLDLETAFLIREVNLSRDENGQFSWRVTAYSMTVILKSRIVAYNQGTSQAAKSGTSDNVMKQVMRENFGTSATTGRNISAYLAIASDLSLGPTINKAFEYRNVFDLFGEIVESSIGTSSPVYFDIVLNNQTAEFRTYVGQRGTDRRQGTSSSVIISPSYSNVGAFTINENYTDEYTFVYAIGAGNLDARMIATAQNTASTNASPFGRVEYTINGSNDANSTRLVEEANAALQLGRARTVVEGQILQSPNTIYGRDWNLGDRLTFKSTNDWDFDVRVDAVQVSISESKESIQAFFRG